MPLQRRSRADIARRAHERGAMAAVIGARRRELGLSQVELAELAGVSTTLVHHLEAGRTQVGLDRLVVVLETLGLHLKVERGASAQVKAGDALRAQFGLDDQDSP
jgi:HTH-type transcriptional regulator / antitoxin HipB